MKTTNHKRIVYLFAFLFSCLSFQASADHYWTRMPGKAVDVAIDETGAIYMIGELDRQIYKWASYRKEWLSIGRHTDQIRSLSAGGKGKVVMISKSQVYSYNNRKWKKLSDFNASDVGISDDGTVWAVSRNTKKIAKWDTHRQDWRTLKTAGTPIDGKKPIAVTVDRSGSPFVVFSDFSVALYHNNNRAWKVLPGKVSDLSCSRDKHILAVGFSGEILKWNSPKQRWDTQTAYTITNDSPRKIAVFPNGTPIVVSTKWDIYESYTGGFTSFLPTKHGFNFRNRWDFDVTLRFEPGIFDPLIPDRLLEYDISQPYGLCGGMSFGAYEYFMKNRPIPGTTEIPIPGSKLYEYILDRQYVSFGDPEYDYLKKTFSWWGSIGFKEALVDDTRSQLSQITRRINEGEPVNLILIYETKLTGVPWDNHQVLAFGYKRHYNRIDFYVYDPNFPNNDGIIVTYFLGATDGARIFQKRASDQKRVYGFFPIFPKVANMN